MPNDGIIVTLVKMPFTAEEKHAINFLRKEKQYSSRTAAIRQWRRGLSAKMCELTLRMILLCNCSLSLNVFNLGFLSTTVLQGSVATWWWHI